MCKSTISKTAKKVFWVADFFEILDWFVKVMQKFYNELDERRDGNLIFFDKKKLKLIRFEPKL